MKRVTVTEEEKERGEIARIRTRLLDVAMATDLAVGELPDADENSARYGVITMVLATTPNGEMQEHALSLLAVTLTRQARMYYERLDGYTPDRADIHWYVAHTLASTMVEVYGAPVDWFE